MTEAAPESKSGRMAPGEDAVGSAEKPSRELEKKGQEEEGNIGIKKERSMTAGGNVLSSRKGEQSA